MNVKIATSAELERCMDMKIDFSQKVDYFRIVQEDLNVTRCVNGKLACTALRMIGILPYNQEQRMLFEQLFGDTSRLLCYLNRRMIQSLTDINEVASDV